MSLYGDAQLSIVIQASSDTLRARITLLMTTYKQCGVPASISKVDNRKMVIQAFVSKSNDR